jgi:hypothetical protein
MSKITLETENRIATIKLPDDATIEEWLDEVISLALFETYSRETVVNGIIDLAREYEETYGYYEPQIPPIISENHD